MTTDHPLSPAVPVAGDSIVQAAIKVLSEPDPWKKAEYTDVAVSLWRNGQITEPSAEERASPPDTPARLPLTILDPSSSKLKRGKGGTLESRIAMVHSLAHIESWAIDLSWDILARFGADPAYRGMLPRQFYEDWVTVAEDECRHFSLLAKRLTEMGSHYGALPVHDALWESASRTAHSLAARLAVEHAVHEARGLDVLPLTIQRFKNGNDAASAELLEGIIYPEEISHCGAGVTWLRHLHATAKDEARCEAVFGSDLPAWVVEARKYEAVQAWFHDLVRANFFGALKGPFNEHAREMAGFTADWYLPLVKAGATAQTQGPANCGCGAIDLPAETEAETGGAAAESKSGAGLETLETAVEGLRISS